MVKIVDNVPLVQGKEMVLALSNHCHQGKHLLTSSFKYSNNHDLDTDPNIKHQKDRKGGRGGQEASFQAEAEWHKLGSVKPSWGEGEVGRA